MRLNVQSAEHKPSSQFCNIFLCTDFVLNFTNPDVCLFVNCKEDARIVTELCVNWDGSSSCMVLGHFCPAHVPRECVTCNVTRNVCALHILTTPHDKWISPAGVLFQSEKSGIQCADAFSCRCVFVNLRRAGLKTPKRIQNLTPGPTQIFRSSLNTGMIGKYHAHV